MGTITIPRWVTEGDDELVAMFGEQGFNERADVIQAADGTDLNTFWAEIQATIRLRNADRQRLIDSLATYVTTPIDQVAVPSTVAFEEASEYGQPQSIRGTATRLFRGYDFRFYDLAVRYTWMFIAEADNAQLQMQHNLALDADNQLLYNKVMKCLFNPLNTQGITDKNEPITAYKFYNGDGETPPAYKTNGFSSSHNHYITSGNTAITPTNLGVMANALSEHGYTYQAGYKFVLWVNPQEGAIIRTFKTTGGAPFDFIPNPAFYGGGVFVPNNGTYQGAPQGTLPGEIGTYGPWHVVEELYIPVGYAVGLVSGGAANLINPIGIREHANPAYRGLKVIPGANATYPLLESFYRRGFGTGIRQRGGGVVMQVTASATYTVPSQYA